jgi:thioredoxin-related protein
MGILRLAVVLVVLFTHAGWGEDAPASDAPPSAGSSTPAHSAETLTLDDGRVLTGTYDDEAQQVTLINPSTGKPIGTMSLPASRIVSRKSLTMNADASVNAATVVLPGCAGRWIQSLPQALTSAKRSHRMILMNFTGSDWCPWCKRLEGEVFGQSAFTAWAAAHVVLLELDFPHHLPQSQQLLNQNLSLAVRFGVTGYPTVLLVSADGQGVVAKSGYFPGGAQSWLADLRTRAHQEIKATSAVVAAPEAGTIGHADSDDGRYLTVIVPDLRAACAKLERTINAVHVGALEPGSVAGKLGGLLGDPSLALLGAGPSLLVVTKPRDGHASGVSALLNLSGCLIIPSSDAAEAASRMQARGLAAAAIGGLVVLAGDPGDLDQGKQAARNYPAFTGTPTASDLRITVALRQLVTNLDPVMQMGLALVARSPRLKGGKKLSPAGLAKALQAEIAAFEEVSTQVETIQIDLTLDEQDLVVLATATPAGGCALQKALQPPSAEAIAALAHVRLSLGAGRDLVAVIGAYSTHLVTDFAIPVLKELSNNPEIGAQPTPRLLTALESSGSWRTGAFGTVCRPASDGRPVWRCCSSASDSAAARAANAQFFRSLEDGSSAVKPSGVSSIELKLVPDVANIPGPPGGSPVAVDSLTVVPAAGSTITSPAWLSQLVQPSYYAYPPGLVIMAQDLPALRDMVAGNQSPDVLTAETALGSGQDGYADLDLPGLIGGLRSATAHGTDGGRPALHDSTLSSPPVVACWAVRHGSLSGQLRVPFAALQAAGAAFASIPDPVPGAVDQEP